MQAKHERDLVEAAMPAERDDAEAALGGGGGPFVGNVERALESIGIGRYASMLLEEEIGDLEVLGLLTGLDLEEIGIPAKDHDALMGLARAERGDAPEEFLCPISCDVMDDPVVAADNRTYEH